MARRGSATSTRSPRNIRRSMTLTRFDDDVARALRIDPRRMLGLNEKGPASPVITREAGLILCDSDLVELGGIEPPSNAESPRLLRAQSVKTFCSAPTFVTDT